MINYPQKVIDSALKTLKAGIINLLESEPMFAQILMNMEYVPANIGTCAVDGKRFLYEPEFLANKSIKDRKFIIAHEALHQCFLHPFQMRDMLKANPKFDLNLANMAMDYVINALLKSTGWRIPDGALYEPRFTHEMEWLQVYRILEKEKESEPNSDSQDNTSDDEFSGDSGLQSEPQSEDNSDQNNEQNLGTSDEQSDDESDDESDAQSEAQSDEETQDETENEIPKDCKGHSNGGVIPANDDLNSEANAKQNISQALEISQRAGTIHSSLQRKIEDVFDILESPWEILQDCISRETVGEKTYRKLSRRTIDSEFILPSYGKDFEIENGVFGWDVSGSVNKTMMSHFWKHGLNIISEYSGTVFAVFCDSELPEENIFEFECDSFPDKLPKFDGGGGTRFNPVFKWIEDEEILPDFLVYFTDMEAFDLCDLKEPDYPVFWMVWNPRWKEKDTPFGITIDISKEKY